MNAGKVEWLVVLNSNPLYSAPADLDFESALKNVDTLAHLGAYLDETAQFAQWHINSAHYLESGRMCVLTTAPCPLFSR